MSTNEYDVFQIARPVLDDRSRLAVRTRHYCQSIVEQDYQDGVVLPIVDGRGEQDINSSHALVGRNLFRVSEGNLILPLYRLEKPRAQGYRAAFIRASEKFDDGSSTVVAQVSNRVFEKDLEYDNPNRERMTVVCSKIVMNFTERGFVVSAEIDEPEQYIEEHKLILQFMKFIGDMKKHSKDMSPDETYVPRIPLARFSLDANDLSIDLVRAKLQDELSGGPAEFVLGPVLPPKIY